MARSSPRDLNFFEADENRQSIFIGQAVFGRHDRAFVTLLNEAGVQDAGTGIFFELPLRQ